MIILEDWERTHIMDTIYLEEEREELRKELNIREPAKIIVKMVNNVYNDKELFNISEVN